ncbi:hypothetical protein QJS04_geneDACA014956 [Acorus gramineus]|uniref:Methyltransferase type 11 domain-containing protein n=1 Tax=Acorus gramineus TaxID=55184 RepID=A0AAV9BT32_ACOGR|nr:hypothetical protein QJS04_geneDACA014956 [Acorus gramineus]
MAALLKASTALALTIQIFFVLLRQIEPADGCDLESVFRDLIARSWLQPGHRAVCVGPDPGPAVAAVRRVGFRSAIGVVFGKSCCGLPYEDGSFDFAFSAGLDRARVPARVVLEMERVLGPGRVGVVFGWSSHGPMGVAAPVASLLRFSEMVGAARAVNGSVVVAFKKKIPSPGPNPRNSGCGCWFTKMSLILRRFAKYIEETGRGIFVREKLGSGWAPLTIE